MIEKKKRSGWLSVLLCSFMILVLLPTAVFAGSDSQTLYFWSFESEEEVERWKFQDTDGDGDTWQCFDGLEGQRGATDGTQALVSWSYKNFTGALNPDNWACSPEIELPAGAEKLTLSYDVFAQDPKNPEETYSVYVSVVGADHAEVLSEENSVLLFTETLTKGEDRTAPAHREIDLSAYAGKTVRIAFRHHKSTNAFAIGIDSVKVTEKMEEQIALKLPFTIEVKQGGAVSPGSQVFELEAFAIGKENTAAPAEVTVSASAKSYGSGSYNGILEIRGTKDRLRAFVENGFYIREKRIDVPDWIGSEAIYFAYPAAAESVSEEISALVLYPVEQNSSEMGEYYVPIQDEPVESMCFENTYIGDEEETSPASDSEKKEAVFWTFAPDFWLKSPKASLLRRLLGFLA